MPEIYTPDSLEFETCMHNLHSSDFIELISAPQGDENVSRALDYMELEEIRKMDNESILVIINEAVEKIVLHNARVDDYEHQIELLSQILINERGNSLEEEL